MRTTEELWRQACELGAEKTGLRTTARLVSAADILRRVPSARKEMNLSYGLFFPVIRCVWLADDASLEDAVHEWVHSVHYDLAPRWFNVPCPPEDIVRAVSNDWRQISAYHPSAWVAEFVARVVTNAILDRPVLSCDLEIAARYGAPEVKRP